MTIGEVSIANKNTLLHKMVVEDLISDTFADLSEIPSLTYFTKTCVHLNALNRLLC